MMSFLNTGVRYFQVAIRSRVLAAAVSIFILFGTNAFAQRAEMTVSLNETFFDALLDSVFQNYPPPEFSIASAGNRDPSGEGSLSALSPVSWLSSLTPGPVASRAAGKCSETIKILREMNGVRTAVRFREGKVYVPLAFSGDYNPMFVGCLEFAGWAEAYVDLEFDRAGQRLIGRARVTNVNINGTGGVGGTLIAKLLQGSIDKKLNPIEIVRLDKVSFLIPVQNAGNIRMRAVDIVPQVVNNQLEIRVAYEFLKG